MTRGTFIENEFAYENAIARNIRANANKTRHAKWIGTADGKRADDFLFRCGEFADVSSTVYLNALHPVVEGARTTSSAPPDMRVVWLTKKVMESARANRVWFSLRTHLAAVCLDFHRSR